jgi:hypothetical protein
LRSDKQLEGTADFKASTIRSFADGLFGDGISPVNWWMKIQPVAASGAQKIADIPSGP